MSGSIAMSRRWCIAWPRVRLIVAEGTAGTAMPSRSRQAASRQECGKSCLDPARCIGCGEPLDDDPTMIVATCDMCMGRVHDVCTLVCRRCTRLMCQSCFWQHSDDDVIDISGERLRAKTSPCGLDICDGLEGLHRRPTETRDEVHEVHRKPYMVPHGFEPS